MSTNNTGGPAFPLSTSSGSNTPNSNGMTLRDYFAAKAMQGMLSDPNIQGTPEEFSIRAYAVANAMIQARNQ